VTQFRSRKVKCLLGGFAILVFLVFSFLELGPMYATDVRQTYVR